jgi:hypothetical protein
VLVIHLTPWYVRLWNEEELTRLMYALRSLIAETNKRTKQLAVGAIVVAWIPNAILAAARGSASSFLTDYAAQSRLLIVTPLLIIGAAPLTKHLHAIGGQFRDQSLIGTADMPGFERAIGRLESWSDSAWVRLLLISLTYVCAIAAMPIVQSLPLRPWCHGAGGITRTLSPAGWWYIFVGLPISLFVLLRWIWLQAVWTWFLGIVSRMDLQLLASHPDRAGGLNFVEACMPDYLPFGLAIGIIVAGGVANRVIYGHQELRSFESTPVIVVLVVLLVCVAPFLLFFNIMLRARRRATFSYGALAIDVGGQFERKWIPDAGRSQPKALEVQDFSVTTDLYSIVANVHAMFPFPLSAGSVTRLALTSLLPAIPLAFLALPFDTVIEKAVNLFL